jgi:hypothetical protein
MKSQYTFTTTPDFLSFNQIEKDNFDKLFFVVESPVFLTKIAFEKDFAGFIDKKSSHKKSNDEFNFNLISFVHRSENKVWFSVIPKKNAKENAMNFINFVNKVRELAREYEVIRTQKMKVRVRI